MRKIRIDLKQVICPNSSLIGYGTHRAKPGYWITWNDGAVTRPGRIIGRIAECDNDGADCTGQLVVMALHSDLTSAGVRWVRPASVRTCEARAPHDLLAWITGDEWVKTKHDAARLIAMSEHGTCSNEYINNRSNPEQAYNARPAYVAQFILPE